MRELLEETWVQWLPLGRKARFNVESIELDGGGLKILLRALEREGQGVLLDFKDNAVGHRVTDENMYGKLISGLERRSGSSFYIEHSLFQVRDSQYVASLLAACQQPTAFGFFTHYSILADDYVVDVVTTDAPIVSCIALGSRG